ncbi:ATP-binding protein [Sagittula stellata]|uniref:Multi-sensor hybrid histidine kinase n=1 Tax=Sagittula stellata (strain ATCC 700073 / DSM 11524 / E-37) TaxID=388399 RepID=A3K9A5_SAGS3|nr:ATP-binding protein [Sagittula stellata]EBA06277.1 multi-sensor hybrid histidine kinase [Sagittula stellata E-37]
MNRAAVDRDQNGDRRRTLVYRSAHVLNAAAFAVGLLNLLARLSGSGPGLGLGPVMVPATSVCVMLLAAGFALRHRWPRLRPVSLGLKGAAVLIAIWGLTLGRIGAEPSAWMSTATGLAVVLAAVLAALPERLEAKGYVATGGLLLSFVSLVSFAFDLRGMQGTPVLAGLSLPTALSLTLIFLAQILASPSQGWMKVLTGEGSGSHLARRFLLPVCIAPLVLAWLALKATELGFIAPGVRLSALSVLLGALGGYVILRVAAFQNERAQAARLRLEELESILGALPIGVFLMDADMKVILTNQSARQMVGDSETADTWLRQTEFHELETRRRLLGDEHPFARLTGAGAVRSVFVGHLDTDGSEQALQFVLTPLDHVPGTAGSHVLTVWNETESWIVRTNMARTERFEAMSQLASGVVHEVANIFGVIRLTTDTWSLRRTDSSMDGMIGTLQKVVSRGVLLIDRLMALARDSRPDLRTELVGLVEETLSVVRPSLPTDMELDAELPEGPVSVPGGPADYETSLIQLILNARDSCVSSGGGGRITVRLIAGADVDPVVLEVRDTGAGMPEDVLARFREQSDVKRPGVGGAPTGLLAVRAFADRMGGRLELSDVPGGGFSARMVLEPEPAPATEAPVEQTTLTGVRVLLVDKRTDTRVLSAEALASMGADVLTAATASVAREILKDDAWIDLLITDVQLEDGVSGDELAKLARQRNPDLRVIYCSGYAEAVDPSLRHVPGLGLRKPVSILLLKRTVALALGR